MDGTDPVENYRTIRSELEQYGHGLADRPEIVAVSKAELPVAAEVQAKLAEVVGRDVILFSSVTGQGLDRLAARPAALQRSQVEVKLARLSWLSRLASSHRPRCWPSARARFSIRLGCS